MRILKFDFSEAQSKGWMFSNDSDGFIKLTLLLSAIVIKSDGRIYRQEREMVKRKLQQEFGSNDIHQYLNDFNLYLKKRINVEAVCEAARVQMDTPTKIQLLHFLTGLTITNGVMVDAEFNMLRRIARLIDVPERSLLSILAMFNYKREYAYKQGQQQQRNQQGQQQGYKKQQRQQHYNTSPYTTISKAYEILELENSATADDLKRAYRKMAKLHHPDRVAHLGEDVQKSAKQKFQKISDAYELIKTHKGFK